MRLQKREITLNEADSLQDMFYLEVAMAEKYGRVDGSAFAKETSNELGRLHGETVEEVEMLQKLWRKSKAEQL